MKLKTRIRVNQNGRVVIPASFRKQLGIRASDEVVLRIQDDELRVAIPWTASFLSLSSPL